MFRPGRVNNRRSSGRVLVVVGLLMAVLFLAGSNGLWVIPVYMVLYGISIGMTRVVISALWAEWYGVRHLGAIRALVAAMMVMASAASPVLFGWMIDRGITMNAVLYMSAAYTALSIVLIVIAIRYPARDPDERKAGVA